MRRGEISTESRSWPLCQMHGDVPRRIWAGWFYCAGHGWHAIQDARALFLHYGNPQ